MSEPWGNVVMTHTSSELAGVARYLAQGLAIGATSHSSAVDALADWAQDTPAEVASAAYEVADDSRALDLLANAALVLSA